MARRSRPSTSLQKRPLRPLQPRLRPLTLRSRLANRRQNSKGRRARSRNGSSQSLDTTRMCSPRLRPALMTSKRATEARARRPAATHSGFRRHQRARSSSAQGAILSQMCHQAWPSVLPAPCRTRRARRQCPLRIRFLCFSQVIRLGHRGPRKMCGSRTRKAHPRSISSRRPGKIMA